MGRMKKARGNAMMKKRTEERQKPAKTSFRDSEDDMDDEIDKFHKSRESILQLTDSENEDFEEPVFDLKSSKKDENYDDEEDDIDEEELDGIAAKISKQAKTKARFVDDDEDEVGGLAAKIAKQAKFFKKKRGIIEDEENEDEDDEINASDWGKKKSAYYESRKHEPDNELEAEEAAAMEEQEARRLQQLAAESLRPEDFGQGDMEEPQDEEEEDAEETMEKLVEKAENKKGDAIPVEKVTKDVNALSKSEKMQAVMSNAPELVGLLAELREVRNELKNTIEPLVAKVEAGIITKPYGKQYIITKHKLLLLYAQAIVFYLVLKGEGRPVYDHPVIGRLVELRTLIEEMRPIDKKLEPQIQRALQVNGSVVKESKKVIAEAENQLPEAAPAETAPIAKKPVEFISAESKEMLKELERLEQRDKAQKQPQSKVKVTGKRSLANLDYDESGVEITEAKAKKLSQVINEAGRRQKKPKIVSGDVDLPVREDIGERRRKYETSRPVPAEPEKMEEDNDEERPVKPKKAKHLKAGDDSELPGKPDEEVVQGKRRITREMETNRGLTPYRNRDSKNPRKKYKTKHGKAVIRRRGQVREIRKQSGAYEGEPTGIRPDISRAIRFT